MKKIVGFALFAGLLLFAAASASAQLRAGESAIYLRDGNMIVDKIVDISSTRHVLQTANNGEIAIRDLWLINYVNDQWNFPDELGQMETNDNYVFLKDGGITSGRIVDFSSTQKTFELDNGEKIAPGRIRRIYFSRQVPSALQSQLQNQNRGGNRGNQRGNQGGNQRGGQSLESQVSGIYRSIGNAPDTELSLLADGTARMNLVDVSGRNIRLTGNWSFQRGDNAIVIVRLSERGGRALADMTFGRERNDLVGLSYDKQIFGQLRLRRD